MLYNSDLIHYPIKMPVIVIGPFSALANLEQAVLSQRITIYNRENIYMLHYRSIRAETDTQEKHYCSEFDQNVAQSLEDYVKSSLSLGIVMCLNYTWNLIINIQNMDIQPQYAEMKPFDSTVKNRKRFSTFTFVQ